MIAANRKYKKVVVLSFGAGQDSTALLYLYLYDLAFREKYIGKDTLFIVIFSDTGNEHPRTMLHVAKTKQLCEQYNIPFFHITPDMGFHNPNWRTLTHQYEKNHTIGMKGKNKKACTFNLKIEPIYRFLSSYLIEKYDLPDINRWAHTKAGLVTFAEQYSQIDMIIGIGAGEEKRIEDAEIKQKWMRLSVNRVFPLVDLGMDRLACQRYIRKVGHVVPPPSNCMLCHFLSPIELLWLYRFYPDDYHYWVKLERQKIKKYRHLGSKNCGVFGGKKLLPEVLLKAIDKHGHMTDDELDHYKMSHGHCVASQY